MSFFTDVNKNATPSGQAPAPTKRGFFGQTVTAQPTAPKARRNYGDASYTKATITTASGEQYTLDNRQFDWIQNRYKSKMADTYGYDDADQLAKRNGQLSAAALKTYKNTNVDRQLAELGLPSEKELGKYLEDYSRWHTGGMDQVFGQMNLPKDYWTKTKGFYQADMQKAYENTAEDQQRKARGLMPSKWEEKYTDTEIDEQLRARGLPPISEFQTYAGRYNNYNGIENFYANVARNETNLRLAGIKDDDNEYSYTDPDTGVAKSGVTGKQLYTDAFFDELNKVNDDGSFVYGAIRPLFKNSSTKEATLTGDYVYDRGAAVTAENKNAVDPDDYASYNAFSYDDYKSKYPELYDRYLANQQTTNGQTVSERLAVQQREEDAEATKEYYTIGKEPEAAESFAHQYAADYPDATPEQMFLDMNQHNVPDTEAYKVYETMKKEAAGTSKWYDIVNGWTKTYGGVWSNVNNSDAPIPDVAKPLTDEQRDAQVEKDLVKAAQQYGQALVTGDNDALYYASERVKTLGFNNQEALVESLKAGKSDQFVQAVKDAITVYESAVAAYEDTAGPGAPSEASREPINKADEALRALGFKSIHDAIRYVGGEKEAMSPAKWVAQEGEKADSYVQSKKDAYANDADTINDTANTIQSTVARLIDKNDELGKQLDVDALLSVLDSISDKSSTNPTAMRLALTDLGFLDDELSGWAGDITEGWSDADKRKLNYYLGGNNFTSMTAGDGGANNDWSAVGSARYSQQLAPEDFSLYLEYALQQVNAGNMTEADAYNLLAAKGYQEEMDAYMPEEWHKAHFIENTAPGLWDQSREEDRLLWEEMTPEEQRAASETLWNDLTPEQKSSMYEKGWWKFDPSVYRTFGQALEQQFQAVLPGLGAEIISTPVKVLDAIEAGISGRPEMWETTQNLMEFQQRMGQLGAVTDNVNGAQVAQTAADVVQELGRMYYYGSIGGAIGAGFAGTSAGAAVMSGAASSSKVVRGASKMFMSMVKSSPFMVSAFANNYSEVKDRGASNSEATWFGLITGLTEGILEGFEFDELWGKALGQKNFAELLTTGKHTYLERLGIIGKSWVSSMAVSGLGEFTEESIGYVLETFLKMRHSDTWGKGTEWSAEDWLQQAMMGFITGALGGGIAAGSSWVADGVKLTNAMKNNPQLQAALPDVLAYNGEADSMPKATLDAYRKGGAKVLSRSAYSQLTNEIENNNKGIENYTNTINAIETNRQKAIGDAQLEVDKLAAKIAPYTTPDESGNIPVFPAEVYNKEFAPLKVKYEAAVRHLDYVTNHVDPETERQLKEAKSKLQNAMAQKESLAKQEQEHWAGLYLMNEHLHDILSEDMLTNLAQAYQNGAKYEPGQAAEQQTAKQSKLAEAEANETMAEAEQAAETPEDAMTKARELAYNRVYKDQEAGKAYAEGRRGAGGSNMTRVEFAENERQNFQAKTTARLRRVTLELAGLEAKDGMSAKEIFDEAKKAMTPEAAQKLDMYQKLSKALGLNMVVRDVVAGTSGYVHDGKLYVTLNGKQSMLRVASHELTHYMKDHASAQYDALRTHLVNEVGQERFDQMLAEKAQEYSLDLNDAKARLETDDEVCAELCERMLENQDALERFVQSDLGAAKTLKARLGKTLVAIKSAIRSLGTSDAQTKADYIKEQETIESWYKGLSDAIDNANRAKGKTSTATETATVTETTTEAQPQAPPVETNPDLYMGDESARREQLRAELQEMAKRGTRVNGLSYQEVNDVLDRVILGDKSNYSKADYAQIRGMLAQLIPEVQAMVNGGESVDVDALNERVSAALDYMLERYSEGSEDYYGLRDLIPNKIALTEAAYNELRSRDMTLREASNELRKALGGKFVSFVYKKSPGYNNAMSIDELWTHIADAYGEPDGYGNIQEDALALIDYAKDRNTRTSFDDLYGSQREDVVNAQVGEFLDAVQSMVEGKNAEQDGNVRHSLYEFPDGTRYVEIDQEQDRFAGKDPSEYPKIAKEIITDKFLQKVIGIDNPAFVNSASRGEYAHPSKRGLQQDLYDAKMQAAGELDNLVDAGRNPRSGKDGEYGHYHKNVTGGYDYTDAIFKIGNRYFEGVVNIENNKNGRRFKDITKIKDVTQDILSSYGENPKSQFLRTSSMGIKSQSDTTVNPSAEHSLDDDYMPLAERYDAGIATDEEIAEMQRDVNEAAEAAGFPATQYDPVIYDANGNVVPLSERFSQDFTGNRYTLDDDMDELIKRYGAIEQGREPRARDVQVPRKSADNMRVSKFTRSLDESSKVTNAQAAEIQSEIGSEADRVKQLWSYIPKSNDETMRKAKEFIAARQPATAQREFHDMVVAGKYGTRTAAIGLQLLSGASARDDWASVKEIAYDLRVLATEAGQSAQIFNVLKDLKGVGSAWYVEKLVNNLNTMYADEIQSGQMDPITVSEAAMNQVRAAKTQVEVDAAERLVADEIGPQLPLKLDEKLSNWRYLSMLGNPVTHIRNVTGNNLMHLMGGMKDVVASGIQRILEKTGATDESDRAHARLTSADKSYWDDFAQKSYDEQKRNLQGGGKLGFQSLVQQSKRSFDNKVLDTIARGKDPGTMSERKGLVGLLQNIRNNGAMGMLEVEDAWGLEKNYKRSLTEYMKAQGYSLNGEGKVGKVGKDGSFTEITNEQMNKAIEWATNQAWTNTFRGPSQLATELNKISKMNTASKLIVEGVMPFKKTPINIAKQGAMYSPAGIVVGTAELLTKVKQGKMSAATAIDHLSSGLTGTALMALGVVLAKAGILRGGGEDKKKLETYLEDTGDQTYAFKFGNVSINMSAIAPATIPLFMGVALQEMLSRNGDDEGVDLSTITDVLAGTLNPFMEMSFMSSLNSALQNYNNEGIGGALGSTIMTAAQNYGSQYFPTLGGKVAQFIDPTQRTTKSSATSPVGGNMDYYWRSLVKKVPGAEATLQPDVNIWGQTTTKDSFGDWALDFANKFILPTNVKVTNRDAVDNELIRVVESTGNVDFLPSDGAKYFKVKGETYKMNASQYTQYSQERGQAAYAALKSTMASASYKNASDEQKADMLKKALDNAYKAVNNTWKEKLGAFD